MTWLDHEFGDEGVLNSARQDMLEAFRSFPEHTVL